MSKSAAATRANFNREQDYALAGVALRTLRPLEPACDKAIRFTVVRTVLGGNQFWAPVMPNDVQQGVSRARP